jgi:hypothetical protein
VDSGSRINNTEVCYGPTVWYGMGLFQPQNTKPLPLPPYHTVYCMWYGNHCGMVTTVVWWYGGTIGTMVELEERAEDR